MLNPRPALSQAAGRSGDSRPTQPPLAAALDHLPIGVIISDPRQPDNPIVYVNRAFCAITGYRPEEAIGRNCRFLQGPGTDRTTVHAIGAALGQRQPFRGRLLNYRADGAPFWNEVAIDPIVDDSGALTGFVAFQTDITAQVEQEAALARREAMIKALRLASEAMLIDNHWMRHTPALLAAIGSAAEVSRITLFEIGQRPDGAASAHIRADWVAPALAPQIDPAALQQITLCEQGLGRWEELLRAGQLIAGPRALLPAAEQAFAAAQGIEALALAPIMADGAWWGFLSMFDCARPRAWGEAELNAFRAAADLLGVVIQRSRMHAAIYESEIRYHSLVANLPGAVYRRAPERPWALRFVSSGIAAITGYHADRFLPDGDQTIDALIHPDDRPMLANLPLTTGQPYTLKYRLSTADGSLRWVQEQGVGVRSADGRLRSIDGILIDITAQEQSEIAYRSLVEQSTQGIALIQDDRLLIVNGALSTILGVDNTTLRATSITALNQLTHPDDRAELWAALQARLAGERPSNTRQFRIIRPSGEIRWIEYHSTRITYQGRPAIQSTYSDITERRHAEEQLRMSEARLRKEIGERKASAAALRALTDDLEQRVAARTAELAIANQTLQENQAQLLALVSALPDSIVRIRADGTLLRVNHPSYAAWLFPPPATADLTIDALAPDLAASLRRATQQALAGAGPQTFTFRMRRPLGQYLIAQGALHPDQLGAALRLQQTAGAGPARPLGAILVEQGMIAELALVQALGRQHEDADHFFEARVVVSGAATVLAIIRDVTARERATAQLNVDVARAAVRASLTRAIAQSLHQLPLTLRVIAQRIGEQLHGACLIALLSDDGQWLSQGGGYHPDPAIDAQLGAPPPRPIAAAGLAGQVIKSQQALWITAPSAAQTDHWPEPLRRPPGLRSVLVVPITTIGRRLGAIEVISAAPDRRYSHDDLRFLSELADRAAFGIDSAQLIATAQHESGVRAQVETRQRSLVSNLHWVLQIADELILAPDHERILFTTIQRANRDLGLERCGIWLSEGDELRGTWQTQGQGAIVDERALLVPRTIVWGDQPPPPDDPNRPWTLIEGMQYGWQGGRPAALGMGWRVITPIRSSLGLVGYFVNDAMITNQPPDPVAQEAVAVLCSLLGPLIERVKAVEAVSAAYHQVADLNHSLQRSRDLLRTIFDGLDDGLVLIDQDRTVLALNQALAQICTIEPAEVSGRPWPQLDAIAGSLISLTLRSGRSQRERVRHQGVARTNMLLDVQTLPVGGAANPIEQVIIHVRDVTEQVKLETRVLENERYAASGRLAATIAHEINTPLQAVQAFLYLFESATPEQRATYIQLSQQEIERIARIVRNLQALYRPSTDTLGEIDLNEIVERVLLLVDQLLDRHRVQVERSLAPALAPIWGRTDQITQVLINLLVNAIQAQPHGGVVRIRTSFDVQPHRSDPPIVVVEISDEGGGIPAEILPHIFEPFYTTKREGNGLGLAICAQIIDEHGGKIQARSAPQTGSTFTIRLPAAEDR